MKVGDFVRKAALTLLAAASGRSLPSRRDDRQRSIGRDWRVSGLPKWAGYLTGRVDRETGIPIMGKRPFWRLKLRDRSKYTPHQGPQECARRVRQGAACK